MKIERFVFSVLCLAAIGWGNIVHASQKLTLQDCYQLALKQSEKIAIQQEQIKEAEGRFFQALSGALPKASFNYSNKYAQGSGNEEESKFTFTQTLFSGFKEFAAMAAAKAQGRQYQAELKRARHLLFIDVSEAFYYYGFYQEDFKLSESIATALSERLEELKKRVDLGRSRASEFASAEAKLLRARADSERIRGQSNVARQLLEFLIGRPLEAGIRDEEVLSFYPLSDDQMAFFVEKRPDVVAAKEAMSVSQKKITIARAGFFPTLSADGDYYTKKITPTSSDWDATLKVSVPLFSGGDNVGKLKEASALARESELVLRQIRREALLEIHQAYENWQTAVKRQDALQKAVAAADKNFQLQAADYRLNLVNNLDVLQALTDLKDVRREFMSVDNEAKRLYWQFKVKTGDL